VREYKDIPNGGRCRTALRGVSIPEQRGIRTVAGQIIILKAEISSDNKVRRIKSLRDAVGQDWVSMAVAKKAIDAIIETGSSKFLLEDNELYDIDAQIFRLREDAEFTVQTDPDSDPPAMLRKAAIAYLLNDEDEKAYQTLQVLLDRTIGAAYS
jgi:hypothetical protein